MESCSAATKISSSDNASSDIDQDAYHTPERGSTPTNDEKVDTSHNDSETDTASESEDHVMKLLESLTVNTSTGDGVPVGQTGHDRSQSTRSAREERDVDDEYSCGFHFSERSDETDDMFHELEAAEAGDSTAADVKEYNDDDVTKTKEARVSADYIDEEALKAKEALMSEDEKEQRRAEARHLKEVGNERYREGDMARAVNAYTDALLVCLLSHREDRAVLYANRSAARMRQDKNDAAIEDCSKALEFNPDYMRALLRRAELYEKTDKLDEALTDYQKALERDPSLHQARAACMRLPEEIQIRNEKLKDEMLSKLKDLGNLVLRPFGLSTDNFKLNKDPNSGGYSINFQQNS